MHLPPSITKSLARLPFCILRFNEMLRMHVWGGMHLAHGGGLLPPSCAPVTPISVNGSFTKRIEGKRDPEVIRIIC